MVTIKKHIKNLNLGKVRVWLNRFQQNAGIFNFAMIGYLFLSQNPLGIEWYYWLIPITILLPIGFYIDIKYVFPQMQEYQWNKNPEFRKLREDVAIIKRRIDKGGKC